MVTVEVDGCDGERLCSNNTLRRFGHMGRMENESDYQGMKVRWMGGMMANMVSALTFSSY